MEPYWLACQQVTIDWRVLAYLYGLDFSLLNLFFGSDYRIFIRILKLELTSASPSVAATAAVPWAGVVEEWLHNWSPDHLLSYVSVACQYMFCKFQRCSFRRSLCWACRSDRFPIFHQHTMGKLSPCYNFYFSHVLYLFLIRSIAHGSRVSWLPSVRKGTPWRNSFRQ